MDKEVTSCAECIASEITLINEYRRCKITGNCYTIIRTSDQIPNDCPLKNHCKNFKED